MGKIFLNKKFNAPNVIEVSINLEKLKVFGILIKRYLNLSNSHQLNLIGVGIWNGYQQII